MHGATIEIKIKDKIKKITGNCVLIIEANKMQYFSTLFW
jgi:hypothetical protein